MPQAAEQNTTDKKGRMPNEPLGASRRSSALPLWTALGVALSALGCAPPGPRVALSATEGMRASIRVAQPLGIELSYLRAGPAVGPRLVLVHGTPGSADSWADYLVQAPPGVEVLALDRPGFGASGPDSAVPSLQAQAAAVLALLPPDDRPVVLLGHSLGAPVVAWAAAMLARAEPARQVSLVLLAGSLDPSLEMIHPLQRLGAWGPVRSMLPRVIRNANAELMALRAELELLAVLLPAVKASVQIVHGTEDDLVPVANVAYMQASFSGARCVRTKLLQGQNHFLPWNSEAVVREAVRLALEDLC